MGMDREWGKFFKNGLEKILVVITMMDRAYRRSPHHGIMLRT
jgi:hypothetical protein